MDIYKVIDSKVIDYAEIVVNLFDHCNMRCVFCPQKHDSMEGASRNEIMSKAPGIINWINNNTRSKFFKIHLMGGELFQDWCVDQGFLEHYEEFIAEIRKNISPDKELVANFVTNLVFDRVDQIKNFLDRNSWKFSISYDPAGRFNKVQLEKFKENVELFKPYIQMISCQMTRQNIHAMLDGDEYFDYLYEDFVCDWDSFIPSVSQSRELMPKESEIFAFYKLLVDRYPNCLNVQHFVNKESRNKMTCTRGNAYTVMYDGTNPVGCSGSLLLRDQGVTELHQTGNLLENFFNKYNCFSCEFFQRCPFTCFIKQDYKFIDHDLDDCVFRKTFQHVQEKEKVQQLKDK